MSQELPKPVPEIEIARITARQAITVALITAIGGIIGGYFIKGSSSGKPPSPPVQHWLTIHSVTGEAGTHLKLVARVNTIPFSYPADVVTTVIGPDMPEQKCPLPIADSYTVSFEAYFRRTDSEPSFGNAKSREAPSFSISQLPTERQRYPLHEVIGGDKAIGNILTVIYSIR